MALPERHAFDCCLLNPDNNSTADPSIWSVDWPPSVAVPSFSSTTTAVDSSTTGFPNQIGYAYGGASQIVLDPFAPAHDEHILAEDSTPSTTASGSSTTPSGMTVSSAVVIGQSPSSITSISYEEGSRGETLLHYAEAGASYTGSGYPGQAACSRQAVGSSPSEYDGNIAMEQSIMAAFDEWQQQAVENAILPDPGEGGWSLKATMEVGGDDEASSKRRKQVKRFLSATDDQQQSDCCAIPGSPSSKRRLGTSNKNTGGTDKNSGGVACCRGVYFDQIRHLWRANWPEETVVVDRNTQSWLNVRRCTRTKGFSAKKYGYQEAQRLAIEHREKMTGPGMVRHFMYHDEMNGQMPPPASPTNSKTSAKNKKPNLQPILPSESEGASSSSSSLLLPAVPRANIPNPEWSSLPATIFSPSFPSAPPAAHSAEDRPDWTSTPWGSVVDPHADVAYHDPSGLVAPHHIDPAGLFSDECADLSTV